MIAAFLIRSIDAPGPASPVVAIANATSTPATGGACSGTGDVELQAQLTANRPVKLAYRWVSAQTPDQGTEQTIELRSPAWTIPELRPARSGPYRLVIDKPVHREHGPVQCQASTAPAGLP